MKHPNLKIQSRRDGTQKQAPEKLQIARGRRFQVAGVPLSLRYGVASKQVSGVRGGAGQRRLTSATSIGGVACTVCAPYLIWLSLQAKHENSRIIVKNRESIVFGIVLYIEGNVQNRVISC